MLKMKATCNFPTIVEGSSITINDASYLFYDRARINVMKELLESLKDNTSCNSMFVQNEFTTINLSNLDTSKVTSMRSMFEGCTKLKELDLSNFNTSKVTDMSKMFYGLFSLEKLNISNFDFTNVEYYYTMFGELIEDITDTRVKANCLIIVKDEAAKEWITSKFDWLKNVKILDEV